MKFPVLAGLLALLPAIAGAEVKSAAPDAMLIEFRYTIAAPARKSGRRSSTRSAGGLPITPGPAGART